MGNRLRKAPFTDTSIGPLAQLATTGFRHGAAGQGQPGKIADEDRLQQSGTCRCAAAGHGSDGHGVIGGGSPGRIVLASQRAHDLPKRPVRPLPERAQASPQKRPEPRLPRASHGEILGKGPCWRCGTGHKSRRLGRQFPFEPPPFAAICATVVRPPRADFWTESGTATL